LPVSDSSPSLDHGFGRPHDGSIQGVQALAGECGLDQSPPLEPGRTLVSQQPLSSQQTGGLVEGVGFAVVLVVTCQDVFDGIGVD
jgi:hypothetical protein